MSFPGRGRALGQAPAERPEPVPGGYVPFANPLYKPFKPPGRARPSPPKRALSTADANKASGKRPKAIPIPIDLDPDFSSDDEPKELGPWEVARSALEKGCALDASLLC